MTRVAFSYLSRIPSLAVLTVLLALGAAGGEARAQGRLIIDGDFETIENGAALRRHRTTQCWYESRNSGGSQAARKMLTLSGKAVGGNATKKAMLKASPKHNTYLTQSFPEPQKGRFALQWDILVKEILPPFNRSAFQMLGNAAAKGRGPNGSNPERFVFLGFENAETPGRMNLFAYEGKDPAQWDRRTLLVPGLALGAWHTVRVDVDVPGKRYYISVDGVTARPLEVEAFRTKDSAPPRFVSHVSFATWDDGPGTFYIDNVIVP
jgi:hypothetical protein